MNDAPIQEIQPVGKTDPRARFVRTMCLAVLLLAGSLLALYATWDGQPLPPVPVCAAAAVQLLFCAAAALLRRSHPAARYINLLPVILEVPLSLPMAPWCGLLQWLNGMIARWNLAHEGGVSLLAVADAPYGGVSFAMLAALGSAALAWWAANRRRGFAAGCWALAWITVQLVSGGISPLGCALLLAGTLCICMSGVRSHTVHTTATMAVLTALLCAAAVLLPQGQLPALQEWRGDMEQAVHDLRYGQSTLPGGDLTREGELNQSDAVMLQVQAQQEKSLYLRAFVGGTYRDGSWQPLADAAYGGDHAGMLRWLYARGFDPLTQTAQYYSLCEDAPESNTLAVSVKTAERDYYYVPGSLVKAGQNARRCQDEAFFSRGLTGQASYTVQETSDQRPAELTVAADWLSAPDTEDRAAYCENEAVYRNFVYDTYTVLDEQTNDLMQSLFWADYETDSDGIYSAITQVRKVLREEVSYTQTAVQTPEDVDPMLYMLRRAHAGNAMLYATVTVQALRAHGIPARYVEGYYLPASRLSGQGTAELTGKDAHAWAEVYFDGIGWMPLDTTPGYYYEAVTLQQMVGLPSAVRKTAALRENHDNAAQITDPSAGASGSELVEQAVQNLPFVLLGLAVILLLLAVLALAVAELRRAVLMRLTLYRYDRAEPARRVEYLEKYIFKLLHLCGVETALGWNTAETDEKLVRQFSGLQPGEYTRVCTLLEKSVYGGESLTPAEERALCSFFDKLLQSSQITPQQRLRLRYSAV